MPNIFSPDGRKDFEWYQFSHLFKLEPFKPEYSYVKHESFIDASIHSSLNLEAKKLIYKASLWEGDLANEERDKSRKLPKKSSPVIP